MRSSDPETRTNRSADRPVGRRPFGRLGFLLLLAVGIAHASGRVTDLRALDPSETRRPDLEARIRSVAEALQATPARCRNELIGPLGFTALCMDAPASLRKNPEALREAVTIAMRDAGDFEKYGGNDSDSWGVTRAVSRGRFSDTLHATLHHKSAHVILTYRPLGTACLTMAARQGAVDPDDPTAGVELTAPRPTEPLRPKYPEAARVQRLESFVLFGIRIEADGEIGELCFATSDDRSTGRSMVQAAIDELASATFEPAQLNGEPVASVTTLMITFDLHLPGDPLPKWK